jgi:hypothetical protein
MEDFPWDVRTPLLPGGSEHTYTLHPHLRKDPLNFRDLSAANPQKVRQLSRTLQEWRAEALAA